MKKFDIDYSVNESPVPQELVGKYIYVRDITKGSYITHHVVQITGIVEDESYPHFTCESEHLLMEPLPDNTRKECDDAIDKMIASTELPQNLINELNRIKQNQIQKYKYWLKNVTEFYLWNGREVWVFDNQSMVDSFIDKFIELNEKAILDEQLELA